METINSVIAKLMNPLERQPLVEEEIRTVLSEARALLLSQPLFLELEGSVNICGTSLSI